MRCAECGWDNADGHKSCINCGSALEAEPSAEETDTDDAMEALRADVRRLSAEVAELRRVMAEYGLRTRPGRPRAAPARGPEATGATPPGERRTRAVRPTGQAARAERPAGQPARPAPPGERPTGSAQPSGQAPGPAAPGGRRAEPLRPADASTGATSSAGPRAQPARRPQSTLAAGPSVASEAGAQLRGVVSAVDWEIILGGNWLARIGALALIIGTGFFLKLAFDNEWIGEEARIGMGVVGGLALVGGGEYWRRRYPVYAQALAGGGVAIVYLSVFSAYAFYQLIGIYPAIGVLAVTSVAAATLAVRHESTSLAILGIVGAYLAPLLIGQFGEQAGTGIASRGASYDVMVYVVLVNVGVLALSTLRNWRWFTLLALLASLASFMAWLDYAEDLVEIGIAQALLTAIFLTFVGSTMLYHVLWRRVPQAFDHSIMVLNAVAFAGLSFALMWDEYREWMGLFTVSLAAFYVLLGALALWRGREQYYLALMSFGIAVVLLAAAVPVQLEGPYFGAAWGAQGAVLVALSFRFGRIPTRLAGYAELLLSLLWLLSVDTPEALSVNLEPFANVYTLTFAIAAATFYVAAYVVWRYKGALHPREGAAFAAVFAGANVLLAALFATQLDSPWFGAAWVVQGAALVALSFVIGGIPVRLLGLLALSLGALWLLAVGIPMSLEEDVTPFTNFYALTFAIAAAAFFAAAYVLRRNSDALHSEENVEFPLVFAGANVLLGALFATQFDSPWFGAAWGVQGAALVALSLVFGGLSARLLGLLALTLSALWLLAVGLPMSLEEDLTPFVNFYALTFAIAAAAFFAAAYIQWRNRKALYKQESVAFPVVFAGANVLLGALFATQLDDPWFGAAWAVQGAALVALSLVFGGLSARLLGLLALALGALRLFMVGLPMSLEEDLTPFANLYALTFAIAAAALFTAAYVLWRGRKSLRTEEQAEFPFVIAGGNVMLAALFATQLGSTWLPIAWSAQALAMLSLWRVWGLWEMRWSGCALLALVAVRLVGVETAIDTDDFRAFLNGRMLAFACGIAALYAAAVIMRGRPDDPLERKHVFMVPSVLAAASFLTLWILWAEAFALVDSGVIEVSGDAEFYAKSLAVSLVLAVYASAALAVGVLRRLRAVRIASLGMLALPVVKLFLFDSFALEQGYRVAAFLCLGALLLAGGFLYQRYQEAIRGFLFEAGESETDETSG